MKKLLLLGTIVLLWTAHTYSQSYSDTIYGHFLAPPATARPRVWWHWMNGNITKDGIRKDLEWMHKVGIGGFQNFDAGLTTPQIVQTRLTFMTPGWQDAFKFTTRLADSLHLEMAIAASPGWSESGGPWVKPEDGMKKVVWSELRVSGGAGSIKLPQPPGTTGPFQNIAKQAGFGEQVDSSKLPGFYRDIAVLAFKLPASDKTLKELGAVVTSSGGNFSLEQLTDEDVNSTSLLPSDSAKGFAWIQFAFPAAQQIKALSIVGGGDKGPFGLYGEKRDTRSLEVSDDGANFRFLCYIPAGNVLQQTIEIPPTTAKFFRVTFKNPPPPFNFGAISGRDDGSKPPAGTEVAEIALHTASRINMFEEKDAFSPAPALFSKASMPTGDVVNPGDIVDLTGKMNPDGSLNWTAPAGNWSVVRFGYSLTGIDNHPASPEATGPEVDKLDPVAIKKYFNEYLDQYKNATGGLMGAKGGLQFMVTDSWEAGAQNWTGNLASEFLKRRGYSLIPWLPVLTGHVVKSAEASEQFLFDFRKTLSDLVAEYHYDGLTAILAARGMKRYSESHESGRALIADGMEVKRKAAVPMSAMWTPSPLNGDEQTGYQADIRESASVAHIFGQNLVAAESMTAFGPGGFAWSYSPENLKPTADLELASGLNRFVIHTSVHQPTDDKIPGLGLGPFGQWFNRHETWADNAKAWTDYLARSSYLLQQGKYVADIVYYYGEDDNITSLFGKQLPQIPEGYSYDFINSDALLHQLSVKDGFLVTPSGMRYRVLFLDANARRMPLSVLKKIQQLVAAGAAVAGIKPDATPSLSDSQAEFSSVLDKVWNPANAKVFANKSLDEVLGSLNILPDFAYTRSGTDTKLLFVHRKLTDRDVYWLNSRNDHDQDIEATFRISGKLPQIWHAETGKAEAVSYRIENGLTKVRLHLTPNDAVFVVFKGVAAKPAVRLPEKSEKELLGLDGEWTVSFQQGRGAPSNAIFPQLTSLTEMSNPGIKYFSGTATYTKAVTIPKGVVGGAKQVYLDLGDVKNLAEVLVNGKSIGVLWKHPFRVEITKELKEGTNRVDIKVTNLWVNRLIGDLQPGVEEKITYTTTPFYKADSPLLPSGLIGPVKMVYIE